MSGCYDNGIFGDEAGRRKPHPDLYNKMMELEGLRPEECIIVEDSANGVKAGYAAGVRVFAIPDTACLEQFRDHEAYALSLIHIFFSCLSRDISINVLKFD